MAITLLQVEDASQGKEPIHRCSQAQGFGKKDYVTAR